MHVSFHLPRTNQQLLSEREGVYVSEPRQALHGRGATGARQLKSRTEERRLGHKHGDGVYTAKHLTPTPFGIPNGNSNDVTVTLKGNTVMHWE